MENVTASITREIMARRHLKQKDLADILGVSLDRVKSLASGRVKKFAADECKKLVEVLGVSEERLASGLGPIFEDSPTAAPTSIPSPATRRGDLGAPFMGEVLEAVMNAYTECGARISPRGAGEQAMLIYSDILAALGPDVAAGERDAALKMEIFKLKRRLSRPDTGDEGKRLA